MYWTGGLVPSRPIPNIVAAERKLCLPETLKDKHGSEKWSLTFFEECTKSVNVCGNFTVMLEFLWAAVGEEK